MIDGEQLEITGWTGGRVVFEVESGEEVASYDHKRQVAFAVISHIQEKKRREAFIVDQDDDRPLTTVSRYINLYAGAGALPFKAEIQRAGNNN